IGINQARRSVGVFGGLPAQSHDYVRRRRGMNSGNIEAKRANDGGPCEHHSAEGLRLEEMNGMTNYCLLAADDVKEGRTTIGHHHDVTASCSPAGDFS